MKKERSRNTIIIGVLLLLAAICFAVGVFYMNKNDGRKMLVPDYAPVEKEENAEAIQNDETEKMEKPDGGGSVSLSYSKEISISLSKGTASLYFANPGKSNEDMLIQIVIQDNVIAQSGTISPGYQVRELELDPSAGSLLQAGTYEGMIVIHYYDQQTNERAVLNTEIPVSVTVEG